MAEDLSQNKVLNELALDQNSIVLDFGANVGNVSHYIYSKYQCNLFLYEPNPYCYEILKSRFKANNKIKIFNKGVLNRTGFVNLYLHSNAKFLSEYTESSSYHYNKDFISKDKKILTEVIDIKEIVAKFDHIDLIKVDIEGAEYLIIDEIIKNFKKINKVICELHGEPTYKTFINKKTGEKILIQKNKFLQDSYKMLIKNLESKNLLHTWFVPWH